MDGQPARDGILEGTYAVELVSAVGRAIDSCHKDTSDDIIISKVRKNIYRIKTQKELKALTPGLLYLNNRRVRANSGS